MISEFSSSIFVHWGQKETQFSQKMTPFRRPLDDRAALFIVKTALHVKVLSFLSTVQQLVLTAGHLWPRFGRRFYHALKTANYTKSDSGPSIRLSSIFQNKLERWGGTTRPIPTRPTHCVDNWSSKWYRKAYWLLTLHFARYREAYASRWLQLSWIMICFSTLTWFCLNSVSQSWITLPSSVETARGGRYMFLDDFQYLQNRKSTTTTFWRCRNRRTYEAQLRLPTKMMKS